MPYDKGRIIKPKTRVKADKPKPKMTITKMVSGVKQAKKAQKKAKKLKQSTRGRLMQLLNPKKK